MKRAEFGPFLSRSKKLERTGEPFRVADVGSLPSVSNDGTLVFCLHILDEFASRQLAWVDLSGRILQTFGPTMPGLGQPQISPDGRYIAVAAGETLAGLDVWAIDSVSGGAIAVARTEEMEAAPFWLENGRKIAFMRREGLISRLYAKSLERAEETLLFDSLQGQTGSANSAVHLSSRGDYFFAARTSPAGKIVLGYFTLADSEKRFLPLPDAFQQTSSWSLSSDEHFLAYKSSETGQSEIYVVGFPSFSGRQIVSHDGGRHPVWHPNGKKLFYLTNDGRSLMSVNLSSDRQTFAAPIKVFDLPENIHAGFEWWPSFYAVAPDGDKFLMLEKPANPSSDLFKPNVLLVQNWWIEFAQKK